MRWVLRSKIHDATVTEANVEYEGSITIDSALMKKAGFLSGEKALVVSKSSGVRLETYIMPGNEGSGIVCINGAAAHLIKAGERVIIMGFELSSKPVKAKKILVNENNKFVKFL
ncbi:MAG: aspartate 1-decarboxylase [Candidatus Diapherotrites archaeon]|nr:aspartate 1-decarboxylase [Candidatus Diapherotrites archaeon]